MNNAWRWNGESGLDGKFGIPSTNPLVPYLSNPTSCTSEPVAATISARSWQEPTAKPSKELMTEVRTPFGPMVGCDRLKLPSTFLVQATTQEAYAPTGLNAELGVHQTYENAEGLASSHLNKAVVTLPEGMTVNPSAGSGLGSCTLEEYEYEQKEIEPVAGEGCRAIRSSVCQALGARDQGRKPSGPSSSRHPMRTRSANRPNIPMGRCSRSMSSRGSLTAG